MKERAPCVSRVQAEITSQGPPVGKGCSSFLGAETPQAGAQCLSRLHLLTESWTWGAERGPTPAPAASPEPWTHAPSPASRRTATAPRLHGSGAWHSFAAAGRPSYQGHMAPGTLLTPGRLSGSVLT